MPGVWLGAWPASRPCVLRSPHSKRTRWVSPLNRWGQDSDLRQSRARGPRGPRCLNGLMVPLTTSGTPPLPEVALHLSSKAPLWGPRSPRPPQGPGVQPCVRGTETERLGVMAWTPAPQAFAGYPGPVLRTTFKMGIFIPILQMWKLRHKEAEPLAPDPTARKGQRGH